MIFIRKEIPIFEYFLKIKRRHDKLNCFHPNLIFCEFKLNDCKFSIDLTEIIKSFKLQKQMKKTEKANSE